MVFAPNSRVFFSWVLSLFSIFKVDFPWVIVASSKVTLTSPFELLGDHRGSQTEAPPGASCIRRSSDHAGLSEGEGAYPQSPRDDANYLHASMMQHRTCPGWRSSSTCLMWDRRPEREWFQGLHRQRCRGCSVGSVLSTWMTTYGLWCPKLF